MKEIKLNDLKRESAVIGSKTSKAISRVIANADYILGDELEKFEKNFAEYCDAKYAVGVANGTAAIFLSLIAAGIGKGDEVITTAISFVATVEAIIMTGAKPRLVDVNPKNLSIDVEKIEKLINKKTKAIVPVYLYGFPVEIEKIKKICRNHKLIFIGDCAQAHGALYKNKIVGSLEDIACFSFMPAKNLGAYGDAGCIVTNDKIFCERLKKLRNHGRGASKYIHEIFGYAERMDNLQAAILNVKLRYLNKWNRRRINIAKKYYKNFKSVDKITTLKPFDNTQPSYHQFVISISNRDELKKKMEDAGIGVGIHYPIPLHLQPCFKKLGYKVGDFPVAELFSRHILSLPIHPFLSAEEVDHISCLVKKYAK